MKYEFNTEKPLIMHIDLNSAFAMAEQQAHPSLRGKPVGVTNRVSKECCVIASSYEAKARGVKVGMRRTEALAICPELVLIETDPPKYRFVYKKLVKIMRSYSPDIKMKSIDEGIIDFHGVENLLSEKILSDMGYEIKRRVKDEIGDWMTINIGIGPNRFLAKQAAGWHKPDGLDVIDHTNLIDYYKQIELTDLSGIARRNKVRLNLYGITTPVEFLEASEDLLRRHVFKSINGTHWFKRLRGFEVDGYDTHLGMVGRQWVVPRPSENRKNLNSCLSFLSETTGVKLRYRNVEARGICVWAVYRNGQYWRAKRIHKASFYTNKEISERALDLFNARPPGIVKKMGVFCYGLEASRRSQLSLFEDVAKKDWLIHAVDEINEDYGQFTVHSATSLEGKRLVKQKLPFGETRYLDLLSKRA